MRPYESLVSQGSSGTTVISDNHEQDKRPRKYSSYLNSIASAATNRFMIKSAS